MWFQTVFISHCYSVWSNRYFITKEKGWQLVALFLNFRNPIHLLTHPFQNNLLNSNAITIII